MHSMAVSIVSFLLSVSLLLTINVDSGHRDVYRSTEVLLYIFLEQCPVKIPNI
jgi:cell division protein FtsX